MSIIFILIIGCTNEQPNKSNIKAHHTLSNIKYAEAFEFVHTEEGNISLEIKDPKNPSNKWKYILNSTISYTNELILPLNPQRVCALSATHIGMLKALNLNDRIVAVSSLAYWCRTHEEGSLPLEHILEIGDGGESNIENFILINPDMVIHSGFDPSSPILKKLRQANIPVLMNYDWKETHPLGRAEWIKVFGFIFGMEEEANLLFEKIEEAYYLEKDKASNKMKHPSVLVGTMYGDIFNAPAGESYMAKLVKDAGANYVYGETEGVGSLNISLESLISNNSTTEIWLNPAASSTTQLMQMNNKFSNLSSVSNRKVFSYYHDVNCFWEQSAISPHLVLQDIVNIISDTNFVTGHFYKRLN